MQEGGPGPYSLSKPEGLPVKSRFNDPMDRTVERRQKTGKQSGRFSFACGSE